MTPNKRSLSLAAALLAGSAMVAVPRAEATVSIAASFDEKVENAAAIVHGRVVKQESRYDDEKRFILTYTTFEVAKAFKGGTPNLVTVVTPGGKVGDVQMTTIGVPEFREGSENVVFLKNTKRGPTVLYFDQGAYEVISDRGEKIVRPVATDAVTIDEQRGMAVAPELPRTLREFESAIGAAERRVRHNRMELLEKQRQAEATSIWTTLEENKWLVFIALLGVALASVKFLRRG
ncbi:MAG TPA: hypothetical protein VFM36_01705 [Thermoanaerobaculia bacterium]|nr:hypothetical protein [Thermoanaerobaculia bacterium]